MYLQIESLINDFNATADESKKQLNNMLSVITEGRVPTQESIAMLNKSIEDLQNKYDMIYQIALSELQDSDMPERNATVSEYVEALKMNKELQLKLQVENIKKVLNDFILVRSLVSSYQEALFPYQKEAQMLLDSLSTDDINVEKIETEANGPAVFLQALTCDDLDSEAGFALLDQVAKYFPRQVERGVTAGKYFISIQNTELEKDDGIEKEITFQIEADTHRNQETYVKENDDNSSSLDDIVQLPEDFSKSDMGVERCDVREDSEFVHSLKVNNALYDPAEDMGQIIVTNSASEGKKISSSVFSNDMRKGNVKVEKQIIKRLKQHTVINESLLIAYGAQEKIAMYGIDFMFKKGYLIKYSFSTGTTFYCPSSRLQKALTNKEASKFAGVSQTSIEEWGESIDNKASSAAARSAYISVLNPIISLYVSKGLPAFSENEILFTDAFIIHVYDKDNASDNVLVLGAFWQDTDECDQFIEKTNEEVEKLEDLPFIVIAGFDKERTVGLAKTIMVDDERFTGSTFYIYVLKEDTYYSYPLLDKVSTDSLYGSDKNEEIETTETEAKNEKYSSNKNSAKDNDGELETKKDEIPLIQEEKTIFGDSETILSAGMSYEEELLKIIIGRKMYVATAYLKAKSKYDERSTILYKQLSYAVNDPMGRCHYESNNVFDLISTGDSFENALIVATAIRTFFSNQVQYDYSIKSFYNGIKDYEVLNRFSDLSQVLYILFDFKETQKKGLDAYADYKSKNRTELERSEIVIWQEANDFYNSVVMARMKESTPHKRFIETKKMLFNVDGDLGLCIKAIVDKNYEWLPLAKGVLMEHFFKEGDSIDVNLIDSDKVWEYICDFWEKAGTHMTYRRNENLMSSLRNNITKWTMKAVELIARWCELVDLLNSRSEDEGTGVYKKIKAPLLKYLKAAQEELEMEINDVDTSLADKAGDSIIVLALEEVRNCIEGDFVIDSRRYYYSPFLLTEDVMLDENYMPDLDIRSLDLKELTPEKRVLDHYYNISADKLTYEKRLEDIFENSVDDYGVAKQIIGYLSFKDPKLDLSKYTESLEASERYAKETAELRKDDFVGELELAQSYGQIDNSIEDKKEKILQIVNEWYEWAINSSNYGFFKKIMDSYLDSIKESAHSREKDLHEQLESYKHASIKGQSVEQKDKLVKKIQEMIDKQNYTVAEDLLSRSETNEAEFENLIEDDYLLEFLNNYDDYYQPVATHQSNFATLVSKRTRNKEERGAKRLADNWLPGGSNLGKERLRELLRCFGFNVDKISIQSNAGGKFENFFVQMQEASGGQRNHYTHPIAAFGSGAVSDGIRVVCINGSYDADGLIEVMKRIGNARHTLILLDHALTLSERRRLARKCKTELDDKMFGVIDRTVMMFLVRHYEETVVNKMLISLIMPFGYYQPYVWESANVMPPELFMGRKRELELIKSATGVNIVYGGRQLGKSALLKKAKEEIDHNENGDRAVYIDIKGKNYKEAAKKIALELYDLEIINEELQTDDWEVLCRAIKKRLTDSKKVKIPYLLLLLDEADVFIDSCEAVNYKPLDLLKEIQGIGAGRFKFVIAGLRNVVKFKQEAALSNNSVLTHLQSMTVKPFNTLEARELMEVPLYYLGLRFTNESLITLILASTNYFPGLIQLYCAKLLDAMRRQDYAKYDEVDTPIYEVSEEHIKKVLADPDFTWEIREKYFITLRLGEDNYYYIIALLMAYLTHNNGYNDGYNVADIKSIGEELGIIKIGNLDESKVSALLEELEDLNIFRKTGEKRYWFTRYTFFQMMGTRNEVEDKLVDFMEE